MVPLDAAVGFIVAVLAMASILQLIVTIWMGLGVLGYGGIFIKKGVKRDLLWVQLFFFADKLLFYVWSLFVIAATGYDLANHASFCINWQWRIGGLLNTFFRTLFMLFLILKLRAIRLGGKVSSVEKISTTFMVVTCTLGIVDSVTLRGVLVPQFENGYLCVGSSAYDILLTLVYVIDVVNSTMVVCVFVKRVKNIAKAAAQALEANQKSSSSGNTRSQLEEIALEARNGGGGAVAIYLANYVVSGIGLGLSGTDEAILIVFLFNTATYFVMCFVIAMSTRRAWVVDANSKLGALYTMFGCEGKPSKEIQTLKQEEQQALTLGVLNPAPQALISDDRAAVV